MMLAYDLTIDILRKYKHTTISSMSLLIELLNINIIEKMRICYTFNFLPNVICTPMNNSIIYDVIIQWRHDFFESQGHTL